MLKGLVMVVCGDGIDGDEAVGGTESGWRFWVLLVVELEVVKELGMETVMVNGGGEDVMVVIISGRGGGCRSGGNDLGYGDDLVVVELGGEEVGGGGG